MCSLSQSVDWHPYDETLLAVASADNTVSLWDMSVEADDDEEAQGREGAQVVDVWSSWWFRRSRASRRGGRLPGTDDVPASGPDWGEGGQVPSSTTRGEPIGVPRRGILLNAEIAQIFWKKISL